MFHVFVKPYLRYGAIIWGNTFSLHIHRVSVLFNRAVRGVLNLLSTTHILSELNKLQVLSVNDIYMFNCCTFIYRVENFMLPINFYNMFVKLCNSHVHTRLSKHDFYLNSVHFDVCKRFITFAGVQI